MIEFRTVSAEGTVVHVGHMEGVNIENLIGTLIERGYEERSSAPGYMMRGELLVVWNLEPTSEEPTE